MATKNRSKATIKSTTHTCSRCGERRKFPTNRKVCSTCRRFDVHIRRGEIREPDYPDTTVAEYKQPMVAVENGYGYVGAITRTRDGKHIQCHICGYFFGRLSNHLLKHNITGREYKERFGLRLNDGLLSPVARLKAQGAYNKNVRAKQALRNATIAARAKYEKKPWKTGGKSWSAQRRNVEGNCKEQTLAKIQRLARINGVATMKDFETEYGGIESVKYWFGTWTKAVEAAGLETYTQRQQKQKALYAAQALDSMVVFYKKYGRTPQSSDFNSENNLPNYKTVSKMYGSLNKARMLAGIPTLEFVPGLGWAEVPPEASNG